MSKRITADEITDEQLRALHTTARAAGDVETARAAIAALSTSEIVVSSWTKVTAREHCAAMMTALVWGAQACREMLASFVAHTGDAMTAMSLRANWNPAWGTDPGAPKPDDDSDVIRCGGGQSWR